MDILAGTIEEVEPPPNGILQSIQPQQIHQEEDDDGDDELTNKESMKRTMRDMLFRGHLCRIL